jgi:hypothetical protein
MKGMRYGFLESPGGEGGGEEDGKDGKRDKVEKG